MTGFLAAYRSVLKVITAAIAFIAGCLVLACGLMIVYEVISRGIFNKPTQWVMELSTYCITIAGFLGMGVAYAKGKHIFVNIMIAKLTAQVRIYLEIFTALLGAFYAFIFTIKGLDMVMMSIEMHNTSPTSLGTPLWIPQSAMPIGMCLLFLHLVFTFLNNIHKVVTGKVSEEDLEI